MPKQYDKCTNCDKDVIGYLPYIVNHHDKSNDYLCTECFHDYMDVKEMSRGFGGSSIDPDILKEMIDKEPPGKIVAFNEPTHYHQHDIDTIEFLKRGFPPQVLTGFLIGNIIKYTQRFEYKNGEEDVLKIVDYANRLKEWYKETHSL